MTTAETKKPASPRRPYSATQVSVSDSRVKIQELIESYADIGLSHPEWSSTGGKASALRFLVEGRPCQIVLRPADDARDPAAEFKRLHRLLLNYLKNALEGVRSRLMKIGDALMGFHMTSDGRMLSEAVFGSGSAGKPIVLALPEARTPEPPSRAIPLGPARGRKPRS